ncbi:MAG: hypothetical protein AB4058_18445 [Microcystaceae cyanobacterium]
MPSSNLTPSSKLIVPKQVNSLKLGELLTEAHLISPEQLRVALLEQSIYPKQRLGEILATQGRIKQQTADFFVEQWPKILQEASVIPKKHLGDYLLEAGLLSSEQIAEILEEQQNNGLWQRFGAIAVFKGWIQVSTIDFFLCHLFPEHATDSPFTKVKR